MKQIGIVADNYKVEKFKKELSSKGYNDLKVLPFKATTTSIIVNVQESDFEKATKEIKNICYKVEYHFKRSN